MATTRRIIPAEVSGVLYITILIFLVGGDIFRVSMGTSPYSMLLKILMLFPMLFWVVAHFRFLIRGVFAAPEILGLLVLVTLSILWSSEPLETAERIVPLWVTTTMAMVLGSKLSLRGVIIAFGVLAAVTMAMCIIAIVTIPSARGVAPWENTWRGAFSHKNGLGSGSMYMMVFATSAAYVTRGGLRAFFVVVAGTALFFLFMSESRTSQGIALISMIGLFSGMALRHWAVFWAISYVGAIIFAVSVLFFLFATGVIAPVFEIIGRGPTLSGRIPLWQVTWPHMMDAFWFGHGYLAFWEADSQAVVEISRDPEIGYIPHYSHSGLIELLLNTGAIGTAIFTVFLIRLISTTFSGLKVRGARTLFVAVLVILFAFLLLNVTESSILARENLSWMIFVTIATKIGHVARANKRSAPRTTKRRNHWVARYRHSTFPSYERRA